MRELDVDTCEFSFVLSTLPGELLLKTEEVLGAEEEAPVRAATPDHPEPTRETPLGCQRRIRGRPRGPHGGYFGRDREGFEKRGLPGPILSYEDRDRGVEIQSFQRRDGRDGEWKPVLSPGAVLDRGQLRCPSAPFVARDLQRYPRTWLCVALNLSTKEVGATVLYRGA